MFANLGWNYVKYLTDSVNSVKSDSAYFDMQIEEKEKQWDVIQDKLYDLNEDHPHF
jgi:hypothetical protein